jgi:hypothetical protein
MNMMILLLSLLSPYFNTPPTQMEPTSVVSFALQPSIALAFQHELSYSSNAYINSFDSLAGVALYATKEELIQAKGVPLNIVNELWQDCLEYQYADMSAGVSDGVVLYIHVTPMQAQQHGLQLSGVEIDPGKSKLKELLGTPDFIAEDGDVYMRGSTALKIYRNLVTGEWDGIDLFDGNSS